MLSYQPQGRCTLRCSACSPRLPLAERGHDLLHVLAAAAVRHEHSVGGLDHDHVVETDDSHQPAGGMHVAVRRTVEEHVADDRVAGRVLLGDLPDRVPGAEIVPAGVQRHDAQIDAAARAALHDRVVHGFRGHGGERLLVRTNELGIRRASRPTTGGPPRGCRGGSARARSTSRRRAARRCRCSSSSRLRPGSAAPCRRRASRRSGEPWQRRRRSSSART